MNKHILYTVFFVVFIVFVFPLLALLPIKIIPGNDQEGFTGHSTKIAYGEITVKQEFSPNKNYLTGVGLSVKNPSNANNKDVFLKIYNKDGSLLRTSIKNGYNIPDGSFVNFSFEPLVDSKNQNYVFEISSPSSLDSEAVGVFWEDHKGIPVVYFFRPSNKLEIIKEVFFNLISRLLPLGFQKSE